MICLTFVNGLRSPFVDRPIKIMGSTIKASQEKVLLGVRFDNDLTFKEHVTSICSKTNQKLHVLTRVSKYLLLQMHHIPIKSFITSQFNYCPIFSMCHGRSLNNKVARIPERSLCMVYQVLCIVSWCKPLTKTIKITNC